MSVRYQIEGRGAAEIAASVETGVRDGALAPGAALPSVRALASQLTVAPATVAAAYQSLRQRGLVETAGRNGTRVRARPPVASRRHPVVPAGTVDLSSGEPDLRLLPKLAPRLRQVAAEANEPIGYPRSGAWPDLVGLARVRLAADGVPADAAITVTAGTLDAMERLLTAHLRPGDRIGVEDPGWSNLLDLAAALGLVVQPIPVDSDGPTVDGMNRAVRAGVSAVVVTTRAQNPTGAAVSASRAAALRKVLKAASEVFVIEDDHAAELAEVPVAALAGAGPRWAFLRSVSKPFGPDLRVAIVAGDDASIARVEGRMRLGAGWVSTVLQRLVLEMWRDPAVDTVITRARADYAVRRNALLGALTQRGLPALGRTGINVWVPVADELSTVAGLYERGWAVAPGSLYRISSGPGIRVTISPLELSDVDSFADAMLAVTAQSPHAPMSR